MDTEFKAQLVFRLHSFYLQCAVVSLQVDSHLFGVVVHHTGGVVHSQADLVLSLAGLGPPQPDLIFAELAGDVRDNLPHVETFPCAVITSVEERQHQT